MDASQSPDFRGDPSACALGRNRDLRDDEINTDPRLVRSSQYDHEREQTPPAK